MPTGTSSSARYVKAIAGPRRPRRRCSQLTGPDSAIARNVATTSQPSGRRNRYTRYSERTTPRTIRTLRKMTRGVDSRWCIGDRPAQYPRRPGRLRAAAGRQPVPPAIRPRYDQRLRGTRHMVILGIVLVLAGAGLLVAEAHLPTYGLLGLAGVVTLVAGGAIAVDGSGGGLAL